MSPLGFELYLSPSSDIVRTRVACHARRGFPAVSPVVFTRAVSFAKRLSRGPGRTAYRIWTDWPRLDPPWLWDPYQASQLLRIWPMLRLVFERDAVSMGSERRLEDPDQIRYRHAIWSHGLSEAIEPISGPRFLSRPRRYTHRPLSAGRGGEGLSPRHGPDTPRQQDKNDGHEVKLCLNRPCVLSYVSFAFLPHAISMSPSATTVSTRPPRRHARASCPSLLRTGLSSSPTSRDQLPEV